MAFVDPTISFAGWFDVAVLPTIESKWSFKEGDVAVLSASKPGSGDFTNSYIIFTCLFRTLHVMSYSVITLSVWLHLACMFSSYKLGRWVSLRVSN